MLIEQNGNVYLKVRDMVRKGSVVKAEKVLRTVRPIIRKDYDMERLVHRLRHSNLRRGSDLASFVNHLRVSYAEAKIEQLYVEKGKFTRRGKFKSRRYVIRKSPLYRYVAFLNLG